MAYVTARVHVPMTRCECLSRRSIVCEHPAGSMPDKVIFHDGEPRSPEGVTSHVASAGNSRAVQLRAGQDDTGWLVLLRTRAQFSARTSFARKPSPFVVDLADIAGRVGTLGGAGLRPRPDHFPA